MPKILDETDLDEINSTVLRSQLPQHISNLEPAQWLNDIIVDAYCLLLATSIPEVRTFATDQLGKGGSLAHVYSSRWHWESILQLSTVMLFPIHHPGHWIAAAAYPKDKCLVLYDSMPVKAEDWIQVANNIMLFIAHQSYHECGSAVEAQGWKCWLLNAPQQPNTFDCGVFALRALRLMAKSTTPPSKDDATQWEFVNSRSLLKQELLAWKLS